MLALLMLAVFSAVWVRRKLMMRRERTRLAEHCRMEAEGIIREREIIDEMEADFLRR
jgi:hypothetical protein